MAAINMPSIKQEKDKPTFLDNLTQVMQIAGSVFGIKNALEQSQVLGQQKQLNDFKIEDEGQTRKGITTLAKLEQSKLDGNRVYNQDEFQALKPEERSKLNTFQAPENQKFFIQPKSKDGKTDLENQETQAKIDLYKARADEVKNPKSKLNSGAADKLQGQQLRNQILQKQLDNLNEIKNSGRNLSANEVQFVQSGFSIPRLLEDVQVTLEKNKDVFGPGISRISTPWSEKDKTIDSQISAARQAFGKYMEGGVLRREDEIKYEKMFPERSDTPEIAINKLANVDRLLKIKIIDDVKALKMSGFNTSAFEEQLKNVVVPEIPKILLGNKKETPEVKSVKSALEIIRESRQKKQE
jgi:hypothetical protein